MEFDAMTLRQVGEYILACQKAQEEQFKIQATLLSGAAYQIARASSLANPKWVGLDELYPQIFNEENMIDTDQKAELAARRWLDFLT